MSVGRVWRSVPAPCAGGRGHVISEATNIENGADRCARDDLRPSNACTEI
jgi:hypothetical protein